jgi:hypothetical protein
MAVEDFVELYRKLERLVDEIEPVPLIKLVRRTKQKMSLRDRAKKFANHVSEFAHAHKIGTPLAVIVVGIGIIFGIKSITNKTS